MYDHLSDNDNCPLCHDVSISSTELVGHNLRMALDIEVDTEADLDLLLARAELALAGYGIVVAVQKLG